MIEAFYRELGRVVRQRRIKLEWSQERLGGALATPMTRASIANIESGKQRVLAHTLVELAVALRVDVSDFLPATAATMAVAQPASALKAELERKLPLSVARVVARTAAHVAKERKP